METKLKKHFAPLSLSSWFQCSEERENPIRIQSRVLSLIFLVLISPPVIQPNFEAQMRDEFGSRCSYQIAIWFDQKHLPPLSVSRIPCFNCLSRERKSGSVQILQVLRATLTNLVNQANFEARTRFEFDNRCSYYTTIWFDLIHWEAKEQAKTT